MAGKAHMIMVERRVLEAVLLLHSVDMPMTGDIVEPIRRAMAAADKVMAPLSDTHRPEQG